MFNGKKKLLVTLGIAIGIPVLVLLYGLVQVFSQVSLNSSYGRGLFLYAWKPALSVGLVLLGVGAIVASFILLDLKKRFYVINLVAIYLLAITLIAWKDSAEFLAMAWFLFRAGFVFDKSYMSLGFGILVAFVYPFVSFLVGLWLRKKWYFILNIILLVIYSVVAGFAFLNVTSTFG